MARAGRKRKEGRREASGRLQRPTLAQIAAAQKSAQDVEKVVVLAQPHRLGNADAFAECALGRFVIRLGLERRLHDAGQEYATLRRKWLAAWSAPLPDKMAGKGGDIPLETVRGWRSRLFECEDAMMRCGVAAQGWVIALACDGQDMPPGHPSERDTADALLALAVELGMVSGKRR